MFPFPPRERSLFVIEQPGKSAALDALVRKAGITNFEIQPTFGLLFDLPDEAIAISPISLLATGYAVKRKEVAKQIQSAGIRADRVFVITDADREGEQIAVQVRQLCPGKQIIRTHLRAMTVEALKEALLNPVPIDIGAATSSAARRIVDRIIGYGFSDQNIRGLTGIVGRVITSAISAFDREPVVNAEWAGKLGPFEVSGTITTRTLEEAKRLEIFMKHAGHEIERLPRQRIQLCVAPPPPCTFADALLEARRRLNISTRDAEHILQSSYERGALSYVRTDSTHLQPSTRALAIQLARSSRLTIANHADHIYLPPTDLVGRKHAHDALHPTFPIELDLDPGMQDKADGLLTVIARRLAMSVAAPAKIEREQVVPAALKNFLSDRLGESSGSVDFRLARNLSPLPTWMHWLKRSEYEGRPRVEMMAADAIVLSFIAASNFGRPSNHTYLVQKLLNNNMVDQHGYVTRLGMQCLAYAKERAPFLLEHQRLKRFEQVLDNNRGSSVQSLVYQLCEVMGVPVEMAQFAVADWYASRNKPLPVSPASSAPVRHHTLRKAV